MYPAYRNGRFTNVNIEIDDRIPFEIFGRPNFRPRYSLRNAIGNKRFQRRIETPPPPGHIMYVTKLALDDEKIAKLARAGNRLLFTRFDIVVWNGRT